MEYINWYGQKKEIPSKELPIQDALQYLENEYDIEIKNISNLYSREDIISKYKRNKDILSNEDFWYLLSKTKYFFNGSGLYHSAFIDHLIWNLRTATLNQLIYIEEFEPYKEAAFLKIKEIVSYDKFERITNEFNWSFYFPSKPSIGEYITKYLNMKIIDKLPIDISDYHFIFINFGITKFGYDHFQDVLIEFNSEYFKKYNSAESLLLEQYRKFYKPNGRYFYGYTRQLKHTSLPIPKKIIPRKMHNIFKDIGKLLNKNLFNSFAGDNSSYYKSESGVNFYKIKSFNNIIRYLFRNAENNVRIKMKLPKVNEGWISELTLYKELKDNLKNINVINHASPSFLGRQHYDIFIPSYKIAIEFQGQQHFKPIDFFGGEEAFKKNIERDERKFKLSKQNDVHLIYVKHGYSLDSILNEIKSRISKKC